MTKNTIILFLSCMLALTACKQQKRTADNLDGDDEIEAEADDSIQGQDSEDKPWQDVSPAEAADFVNEFYTHMPEEGSQWDDAVLEKYLGSQLLKQLSDSAKATINDADVKYASWLLTCTDFEGMCVYSKSRSGLASVDEDGIVGKYFLVFYFGDPGFDGAQSLTYTVKQQDGRKFITAIDGMDGTAVQQVWEMKMGHDEQWEEMAEAKKQVVGRWQEEGGGDGTFYFEIEEDTENYGLRVVKCGMVGGKQFTNAEAEMIYTTLNIKADGLEVELDFADGSYNKMEGGMGIDDEHGRADGILKMERK